MLERLREIERNEETAVVGVQLHYHRGRFVKSRLNRDEEIA